MITRFSGHKVSLYLADSYRESLPLGRRRGGNCDQYCDGRSGGSSRNSGRSPLCIVTIERRR